METKVLFNGVWVVLTTGQTLAEVQNFSDAETIISIYPHAVQVLRGVISATPRYRIEWRDGQKVITCLQCNMTSYDPSDILYYYCGACDKFHEQPDR